jgi:hypothetical protein
MALHFLRLTLAIVIITCTTHAATAKPTILFLPLSTRDEATRETAAQITKMMLDGLSKLDIATIIMAPDVLGELGVDDYEHLNKKMHTRISEIAKPDYILTGDVGIDKIRDYSLNLMLTDFTTGINVYGRGFKGMKDWAKLVNSHLQAMPGIKIFIKDPEARRAAALSLLTRYCPDGSALFGNLPEVYEFESLKFDILDYLLSPQPTTEELSTAVHEACHAYTRSKRPGLSSFSFFISPKETITLSFTDTFSSKELAEVIPVHLREMRYRVYIVEREFRGVYSFLNEFNAYYHGTLASCDLLEYYRKEVFKSDPGVFVECLRNVHANAYAYYQFKYFIFEYLLYAKAKHPEVYRKIIANKEFIEVFRKVDMLFANLIVRISDNEQKLSSMLTSRDYIFYKEGEATFIGKGKDVIGYSSYDSLIMLYRNELKNSRFAAVEAIFR